MYDPVATLIIASAGVGEPLHRTLAGLMTDPGLAAFQVVVVCHGCEAARADAARGLLPGALVLHTPHAGAWRALNLGMSYAVSEILVAVEAGAEVSVASLVALIEPLRRGEAHLALAPMVRDLSGLGLAKSLVHRLAQGSHRRVWGAFALSDRGVARAFPLAARPGIAARLARAFTAAETRVVAESVVRMRPGSLLPQVLAGLVGGARSQPVRTTPATARPAGRRAGHVPSPQTLLTEERRSHVG